MATDLDQLFAALRTDADVLPLSPPAVARTRGTHRRRVRLAAAIVATICLVAGVASAGAWLTRGHHLRPVVPPTTPTRTVDFSPLTPVTSGNVPLGFPGPDGPGNPPHVLSAIVGDRGYVAWHDGAVKVAAVDLRTGKQAWPTRNLGTFGDWPGMFALRDAVVVFGEHDDGSTPDHLMFVLDPADGSVRWQRGVDSLDLEAYDSVFVITEGGVTSGLDWRTGAVRWSMPSPGGAVRSMMSMSRTADLDGPSRSLYPGTIPTDNRLLQITEDRTLRIYDARTGQLLDTRNNVGSAANSQFWAYDGRLYEVDPDKRPGSLIMYDLDRRGEPQVLYTPEHEERAIDQVAPCGEGRICLIERPNRSESPRYRDNELVVVDIAKRRQVWRALTPDARWLSPVGDRILVSGGRGTPLYDRDGRQLGAFDERTNAGRVTNGSLLLFRSAAPADGRTGLGPEEVEVFGVVAADGSRTPLGRFRGFSAGCAWDTRFLVCPTDKGVGVWRYTKD